MLGSCSVEDMINVSNNFEGSSEEDSSQEGNSQEDDSKEDDSQEDSSQEGSSQEDDSQEDGSQEGSSQEDDSQEDSSQEDDSEEDGSQEGNSQEDDSQEDGSQEGSSQENDSQEDGSQEDDSQEDSPQAAAFINCRAVSENEIEFEFSQLVIVKSLSFEPALAVSSIEDGSTVRVLLEENAALGALVTADLLAEDEHGNEINALASFQFRSSRIPELVINELCTEYSNPKAEFIELKMKSYGNLDGIRIFIMGDTTASRQTIYEFLPVRVKNGEYVVLHLRTMEEFCVDEYNGDIEESGGTNSSPLAWDFWIPESKKLIRKEATIIYVLDQNDNVLDAVMISTSSDSNWTKDYLTEAAEFLFQHGAWKTTNGEVCGPADTVNSSGTSNTRTICRDETAADTNTAADWYITVNNNATPGKANSDKRY